MESTVLFGVFFLWLFGAPSGDDLSDPAVLGVSYLSVYTPRGVGGSGGVRFDGGASWTILYINLGGGVTRGVEAPLPGGHGVHIGHVNWEPDEDNGSVTLIVHHRSANQFNLQSLTLNPQFSVTIDHAMYIGGCRTRRIRCRPASLTRRLRIC